MKEQSNSIYPCRRNDGNTKSNKLKLRGMLQNIRRILFRSAKVMKDLEGPQNYPSWVEAKQTDS